MEGLSNIYIYKTLKKDMECSNVFIGVYSSDNLDIKKCVQQENFIAICNLSKEGKVGSHFVTIFGTKDELLYIDSFALPCTTSASLYNSLKQLPNRKIITLLKRPIQSSLSEYCGFFCILFTCLFDFQRFPNVDNLKPFNKHILYNNDKICIENIKMLIKRN